MSKKKKSGLNLERWAKAQKRYKLSDAHVQMALELGLNPKNFRSLAPNKSEPWKRPLSEFIQRTYSKKFGRARPKVIRSLQDRAASNQTDPTPIFWTEK